MMLANGAEPIQTYEPFVHPLARFYYEVGLWVRKCTQHQLLTALTRHAPSSPSSLRCPVCCRRCWPRCPTTSSGWVLGAISRAHQTPTTAAATRQGVVGQAAGLAAGQAAGVVGQVAG